MERDDLRPAIAALLERLAARTEPALIACLQRSREEWDQADSLTVIDADLANQIAASRGAPRAWPPEPGQMVFVRGHTDDRALRGNAPFASNWDLSAARALAVTRVLIGAGLDSRRIVAAGFGAEHPRVANADEAARRKNRRIEVLLVPMGSVASR